MFRQAEQGSFCAKVCTYGGKFEANHEAQLQGVQRPIGQDGF